MHMAGFSEEDNFLIQLGRDYYVDNLSITEMTKKYHLSRYKLLKFLDEAKEKKLIEIKIHSPYLRNADLEKVFSQLFPTQVLILKENNDLSQRDFNFWGFAAGMIQEQIEQASIVNLSWGDTVYKTIEQFSVKNREDLIFTQFVGEIGKYHSLAGSMRLVQKAANKYEARYLTLCAPLYLLNNHTKELLMAEPILAKTLAVAKKADLLLSGIGTPASIRSVDAWHESRSSLFPNFEQAVGFLYGRPFNQHGQFLVSKKGDKTFGLTIDEILQIPTRVGICNSKFKANALLGALKGNLFTHLVMDEKSAVKVLTLLKKAQ